MKWVLGILAGIVVLGGVGVGAYMLGKSNSGGDEAGAATEGGAAPAGEGATESGGAAGDLAAAAGEAAADASGEGASGGEEEAEAPRRVEQALKPENWPVFTIELGVFRDLTKAREFHAAIPKINLESEIVETVDISGKSWYRIRMGKFDDPRQAGARLREVEQAAGLYGIVVTELPVQDAAPSQ